MMPQGQWLQQKESTLAWLRLVFSLTAILVIQLNPQWTGRSPILSHLSLYSFFLYSLLVLYLIGAQRPVSWKTGFVTTCLDLFWTFLIVSSTDGSPILTFASSLFPITTASFRYGIKGSLSVASIEATLYGFIVFSPFWGRPMSTDTFITFSVCLLGFSYILGCLFDLEMKQVQKLMSLCNATAKAAIQEERRRISRELHDRVLQVLGSITFRLEACRKYLIGSPKELETELALSEEAARSSMTEIRSLLSGEVMYGFTPGTLLERLREETELLRDRWGLRVVLEATPEHFELAQEVEQEIYYTVREGLTNIARHSRASSAFLSLKQANGELMVCLKDNGIGFEPTTTKGEGTGYGLQSMRDRVSKLGGDLSVETATGRGTHLCFVVPLSPIQGRRRPGEEAGSDATAKFRERGVWGWSYLPHGAAAVFAILLLVAVPYLFWPGQAQEKIFDDMIAQYLNVTQGIRDAPRTTPPPVSPARLLDLSPWGYRLLSWHTRRIRGQPVRVFVYMGQDNKFLLAQECDGVELSLSPEGHAPETSRGGFVSYTQAGVNLVAWQDINFLCLLASRLPKEKLLSLAEQVATSS
ncbi:MAG: sensor histidine kinase [Candidatus Binatia bacterium]